MEPPNIEGAVRCIEVASVGSFPDLSVTVLVIPRVYLTPPHSPSQVPNHQPLFAPGLENEHDASTQL